MKGTFYIFGVLIDGVTFRIKSALNSSSKWARAVEG